MLHGITTLAIGPGLGREPETAEFVRELVLHSELPTVLDADGLNAFEGRAESARRIEAPAGAHAASRRDGAPPGMHHRRCRTRSSRHRTHLCDRTPRDPGAQGLAHPGRASRRQHRRQYQRQSCDGQRRQRRYPHRHRRRAGRAISATHPQAVECAVWLHGAAADLFAREQDEHTMLATEMLQHLSQAIQTPVDRDKFTWFQEGQR